MIEKLNLSEFTKDTNLKLEAICEAFDYFLEGLLQPEAAFKEETDPLDTVRKTISHLESVASTSDRAPQIFEKYAASAVNMLTIIQQEGYANLPGYKEAKLLANTNIEIITQFLEDLKTKKVIPSSFKAAYQHTMGMNSQPVKQDYINQPNSNSNMLLNKKPNILQPRAKNRLTLENEPYFMDPNDPHPYGEARNKLLKEKLRQKLEEVFAHETASDLKGEDLNTANSTFGDRTTASINPEDKQAVYIDRILYQLELAHSNMNPTVPKQAGQYRELPVTDDSVSPINVNFFKLAQPAIRDINNAQFQLKNDRPKLSKNVELIQKILKKIPLDPGEIFPVYLISKDAGMKAYNAEGPAINASNEGYYSEETTTGSVASYNKPLGNSPLTRKPKTFLDYVDGARPTTPEYQHSNTHHAKFSSADGLNKFKKSKV